jgi:hypothetical protein
LTDADGHKSLEVAEKFADSSATERDLTRANSAARKAHKRANTACAPRFAKGPHHVTHPNFYLTHAVVEASSESDMFVRAAAAIGLLGQAARDSVIFQNDAVDYFARREAARAAMLRRLTHILRDIFGNPFRPVSLDPSWISSTVTSLAQAIYDDHAFDRMPILADALEDAGCTNQDILAHCRGGGEHVRGCWVVDLLLGKT